MKTDNWSFTISISLLDLFDSGSSEEKIEVFDPVTNHTMYQFGMVTHKKLHPKHDIRWEFQNRKKVLKVLSRPLKSSLEECCLHCCNLGYEGSEAEYGDFCYAKDLPDGERPIRKGGLYFDGSQPEELRFRPVDRYNQRECLWVPSEFVPSYVNYWRPEHLERFKKQVTERFGIKYIKDS